MNEFKVMGKSQYGTEELDIAESLDEAQYMVDEYTMAFGPGWEIWIEEPRSMKPRFF